MAVSPGKADRRQSMPDIIHVRRDSHVHHQDSTATPENDLLHSNLHGKDKDSKKKSILSSIVSFFAPKNSKHHQTPQQQKYTKTTSRRLSHNHLPNSSSPLVHNPPPPIHPNQPMVQDKNAPNATQSNSIDEPYLQGLSEKYSWGPKIGSGAFSTVREVYCRNVTQSEDRIKAAKIVRISVRAVEEDEEEQEQREKQRQLMQQGKIPNAKLPPRRQSAMTPNEIQEEIALLQLVQHANIAKLHEVIQYQDYYYIIMDKYMCDIENAKPQEWSFSRLSFVAAQICLCLFHLHSLDVCHRDLKPQNIFLKSLPHWRYPLVVISDFGLATRASQEFSGLSATSGSLFYLAPEVLQRKYGRRADMWSLGVCIYWMLYGCMPFTGKDDSSLAKAIQNGNVRFPSLEEETSPAARKMANAAVDFLKQILVSNPRKRLSSYSALKHPFIRSALPELPWAYETIRAGKERLAQNDILFHRNICAEMGITTVQGILQKDTNSGSANVTSASTNVNNYPTASNYTNSNKGEMHNNVHTNGSPLAPTVTTVVHDNSAHASDSLEDTSPSSPSTSPLQYYGKSPMMHPSKMDINHATHSTPSATSPYPSM